MTFCQYGPFKNKVSYLTFLHIGLDNLDQLVLNHNLIEELKAGMFTGLPKLNDLKLTYNHIHRIDDRAFEGLEGEL